MTKTEEGMVTYIELACLKARTKKEILSAMVYSSIIGWRGLYSMRRWDWEMTHQYFQIACKQEAWLRVDEAIEQEGGRRGRFVSAYYAMTRVHRSYRALSVSLENSATGSDGNKGIGNRAG